MQSGNWKDGRANDGGTKTNGAMKEHHKQGFFTGIAWADMVKGEAASQRRGKEIIKMF